MQIEHNALANFILDVCDFSELYEDDAFVVELEGQRFYVERKLHLFIIHVGAERIRLPRC